MFDDDESLDAIMADLAKGASQSNGNDNPPADIQPAGVLVNGQDGVDNYDNDNEDDLMTPLNEGEKTTKQDPEFDLIQEALRSRGFSDMDNIKFQTDTGIINKRFDELSNEEKLDILNLGLEDYDLNDDEINTINFLRENNVTFQQVAEYYKKVGVDEYLNNNQVYEIDSLGDEDIYRMYLVESYPDFTEEEVEMEVDAAKGNEALFKRKVDKLRETYKQLEQQEAADRKTQDEKAAAEAQEQFKRDFSAVGQKINNIYGMDIDEEDKQKVLDYAFKENINGEIPFWKDLRDPQKAYKIIFLATHADDIINQLHTMYQLELSNKERDYLDKLPKNPSTVNKDKKAKLAQRKSYSNDWEKDLDFIWGLNK